MELEKEITIIKLMLAFILSFCVVVIYIKCDLYKGRIICL